MDLKEEFLNAASTGNIDKIVELLNGGMDVDTWVKYGTTALMQAALEGNLEAVKLLVEKGADVNKFNQLQWTALCYAATRNHFLVVDYLIQSGADVNAICQDGSSILEWVIRQQDERTHMVSQLLKHGAQITSHTMHIATVNHQVDIYEQLRSHSASSAQLASGTADKAVKKPWWKVWQGG